VGKTPKNRNCVYEEVTRETIYVYKRYSEAHLRYPGRQKVLHIVSICVCKFRYPACRELAPYHHLWPVWLYHIFYTLSHKRHDFRGKKLLDMKSVFLFYVQNVSETFLILRRIQWNHIINVLGLQVKYSLFLSDFNETWIFLTNFRKILKYQISRKSVKWQPSYFHDDGQTDRHERGSSRFSQFMEFLIPFGPEYSLPPGDNPIAVNKYYYYIFLTAWYLKTRTDKYA